MRYRVFTWLKVAAECTVEAEGYNEAMLAAKENDGAFEQQVKDAIEKLSTQPMEWTEIVVDDAENIEPRTQEERDEMFDELVEIVKAWAVGVDNFMVTQSKDDGGVRVVFPSKMGQGAFILGKSLAEALHWSRRWLKPGGYPNI